METITFWDGNYNGLGWGLGITLASVQTITFGDAQGAETLAFLLLSRKTWKIPGQIWTGEGAETVLVKPEL